MRAVLGLVALLLTGAAAPLQIQFTIPETDEQGASQHLQARLCRAASGGRSRLVVINHGAPATLAQAPSMVPTSCDSAPARWFNARGYAVLFALRRGFGASTGRIASSGYCETPDFAAAGLAEARDVAAIVEYGRHLPGIDPDRPVVIGQSTGGWAALAYDTLPHPPLGGLIVMAGGRGGRAGGKLGATCGAEQLEAVAGQFGAASRTPGLWVYARNDELFGPSVALALHAAFTRSGGRAELAQPDFPGTGAHRMLYRPGGEKVWGPLFDRYLAR